MYGAVLTAAPFLFPLTGWPVPLAVFNIEMPSTLDYHQLRTFKDMKKTQSCAVLFSGGLDSTTVLYWALARFSPVYALTFDYGQRHRIEIQLARRAARRLEVSQVILKAGFSGIGGSALTDLSKSLPRFEDSMRKASPPATYVPFRNGVFLSLAAAWAEGHGVNNIACGFHAVDSPDYPDTKPEFVRAMEKAINEGTKAVFGGQRMKVLVPLIGMDKVGIIKTGLSLRADYSLSYSCYAGGRVPCGKCAACRLRTAAWKRIGQKDPYLVRLEKEGGK